MTADEPSVNFDELVASHILVVDDNPTNRELVRSFFNKTHHRISEAVDGRDAVNFILANVPDVVLMDIRMPVMDGRAALKLLRHEQGLDLLPIIAVTASSMAGEEHALRESFSGYVRKPFSRAQLYRELAQFIPRKKIDELAEAVGVSPNEPAPATWIPLVTALKRIETTQWPAVRDGMVLSEIQEFAATLSNLASHHKCPPLAEYAAQITRQVDDYALTELEKSLASFANRISELERRLPLGHDS
jgi:CheY-like chemotaxis protein